MDLNKFQQGAKYRGLKMEKRTDYKGMVILVADGYVSTSADFKLPHYFTLFAVGRSTDKLDVASFAIYEQFKDPLGKSSDKAARVKEATEHAKKFIDACTRQREYDA